MLNKSRDSAVLNEITIVVRKRRPTTSNALALPDASMSVGPKGKTGKKRKVVLGALCLQSIDLKVMPKSWAFHRTGKGPVENLCTSPKQLFSQPLSVSGERLAKGLKADLRDSVGTVAWPVLRLYISIGKQ